MAPFLGSYFYSVGLSVLFLLCHLVVLILLWLTNLQI